MKIENNITSYKINLKKDYEAFQNSKKIIASCKSKKRQAKIFNEKDIKSIILALQEKSLSFDALRDFFYCSRYRIYKIKEMIEANKTIDFILKEINKGVI